MRLCYLCVVCVLSACTWSGVVESTSQQLATWRLIDKYATSTDFRWRLPANAHLETISTPGAASPSQKSWQKAAQQGLNRVFSGAYGTNRNTPTYFLRVAWPDSSVPTQLAAREKNRTLSLFGVHTWPALPRTGTLRVHLLAESGDPIYQADMQLSPRLWGPDWQDQQVLEDAFFALAVRLRGS